MKTEVEQTELMGEFVLPIKLRIELERHGNEDGCVQIVERSCHFYSFAGTDNGIDLFNIVAGRLQKTVCYNGVLSVEELS
jgi:hypothetical protein